MRQGAMSTCASSGSYGCYHHTLTPSLSLSFTPWPSSLPGEPPCYCYESRLFASPLAHYMFLFFNVIHFPIQFPVHTVTSHSVMQYFPLVRGPLCPSPSNIVPWSIICFLKGLSPPGIRHALSVKTHANGVKSNFSYKSILPREQGAL